MVVGYGGWKEGYFSFGGPGCEMVRTWLYNMGDGGTWL